MRIRDPFLARRSPSRRSRPRHAAVLVAIATIACQSVDAPVRVDTKGDSLAHASAAGAAQPGDSAATPPADSTAKATPPDTTRQLPAPVVPIGPPATDTLTTAGFRWRLDAPFCAGSRIALAFMIDSIVVGRDTLTNGQLSRRYPASTGVHRLRALSGPMVVSDTTLTGALGRTPVAVAPFYCS
ncbi:MAG: hypothetical protein HY275_14935 [Gemmatimonadetes bacterium]|nr:hypothetical protein [Gemmatimonadota bacterium]